eukprot:6197133-Pleurochrysis_carterae.AAC.1
MGSYALAQAWRTRRGWTSRPYALAGRNLPLLGDDTTSRLRSPLSDPLAPAGMCLWTHTAVLL